MASAVSGSALTAITCGLALAALPVFLVGGLAVQIRSDLGLTETQLGAAVTLTFVVGGLSASLGGRLSDRMGARASVLTGAALASLALVGISLLGSSWGTLAVFLGVAGTSFAFVDPGLAIVITRTMPADRHGLAFGLKEAAIPTATLFAGLAVPAVALTLGWRWAFAVGVIPLAGLLAFLPRLELGPVRLPGPNPEWPLPPARRAVVAVAVAAALGSAASAGIGVFLTESAVAMGLRPGPAGLLLAAGSIGGIVTRVYTGMRADRNGGPQVGFIAGMLATGALSMATVAVGPTPLLVVGTLGAFAGGWGWSGLFFLSLVRATPATPGAAAGIGLTGLAFGNALGPLAFGATAQALSFRSAWAGAALLAALGAALMLWARPAFDR